MWTFIDRISYSVLISFAILMLLLPFRPMPHVVEKLIMLQKGILTRPLDIFDLFYHFIPTILLMMKVIRDHK